MIKKLLLLVATVTIMIQTLVYANVYTNITSNSQSTLKRRTSDQSLMDSSSTTTTYSLPIYVGYAPTGAATTDNSWRVCKNSESANVTTTQCVDGAWSDRATLTYA